MDFNKLKCFLDCLEAFDVREFDISVYKNNKEIFRYLKGYSDAQNTKTVSKNNLRWIFSMTKVVTCTTVFRLIEQGKLSLDDRVSEYLPEYANMSVLINDKIATATHPMLIRHLFTMQSGMDYSIKNSILKDTVDNGKLTTRELVKAMAKRPLSFEPGTKFQYGLSHDVLSAVAEVIEQKSWHQILKKELFIPLEIENMGFHPTDLQLKLFTQKYRYDNNNFLCIPDDITNSFCLSNIYESGGAGLFSTTDEYMKIINTLANYGLAKNGYRVLQPETVNLMRTNQVPNNGCINKTGYGYGFGVRTLIDKEKARSLSPIGEFGWDGAASSYNVIDPENKIAIGFFTHITGTSFFNNVISPQIRNLVYEALEI